MNWSFGYFGAEEIVLTVSDGLTLRAAVAQVPEVKRPEIPPPVWDDRPVRGEDCMAATRALCG